MSKTKYLSYLLAVFLAHQSCFAEATKNESNSDNVTDKSKEKTSVTVTNTVTEDDSNSIDLSELPLDEETKAVMLEVRTLQLEIERLELQHKKSMLDLQAARDKLVMENELQAAEETKLQAKLNETKTRLELENTLQAEQQKQIHAQLSAENEKITLINSLQEQQNKQQELKTAAAVLKFNDAVLDLKLQREKLELQLALQERQNESKLQAAAQPEYSREPFANGRLVISDRRIDLNGVIWRGTAQRIIEQIEFFNNQDSNYPIFIVIDVCYGGSLMQGMQIVKAMRNSRSPVYVVVKGLSASMCAVITTLAQQSFALPDAVFVHHQPWSWSIGNRTEQREQLAILEEWTQRALGPVAEKMGLSVDDFIKQMYTRNSWGDWEEFGDNAVKLKWVDHVVADIRETGYLIKPGSPKAAKPTSSKSSDSETEELKEQVDEQGKRYVKMPRLHPSDVYYIHNPDNYYR